MRKLWLTILVMGVSGLVLMTLGMSFGAQRQMYIDMRGLHVSDNTPTVLASQKNIQPITELDLKVAAANIQIIPSDSYGFEIQGNPSSVYQYSAENGKLTIKEDIKSSIRFFNINLDANANDVIKVYIPSNAAVNNTFIKTASGSIAIDGLNSKDFTVEATSGYIELNNVTATSANLYLASGNLKMGDCSADAYNIEMISGRLTATDLKSNQLTAKLKSGNAVISGELVGNNQFDLTSGNLTLTIAGANKDYSKNIKMLSGSVYIDDQKISGDLSQTGSGKHLLGVKITSGKVEVNFTK